MNKNVLEFLESYIGLESNPEYAVMLKGKWGCGKTWFIKRFIEKVISDKKLKKSELVYISVYGVQNIEQLEMEFIKAIHPIFKKLDLALLAL
ncbi:P-loop NTPase fold protein [Clostridium sp.]|uniref:P-loop NTPase fold protein n=1 Tax=Clostridium sp. TaxID=1506 RepID=UPI0025C03C65|nr:P-loop NTPase fold protein [Clostridium sp.]